MPNRTKPLATVARIRELLSYDPETGSLTWLASAGQRAIVGAKAGCLDKESGYIRVRIDNVLYYAHHLAWVLMTGDWPATPRTDHKDRVRSNNKWGNIREATHSENRFNSGVSSHNKSGFKGVSWCTRAGRWRATIEASGRYYSLGLFSIKEDAHVAYCEAARRLHGEFARTE